MHGLVVALDGPGSSGKSSVGAAAAQEVGYRFFDTGLLYRALTWLAEHRGVSVDDAAFSELERLVVRFADEWTRQGKASAKVVAALNRQLSPAQMVVLAATVGLANWTNRFNETFGVQLP